MPRMQEFNVPFISKRAMDLDEHTVLRSKIKAINNFISFTKSVKSSLLDVYV